jgi:hypothetical protein
MPGRSGEGLALTTGRPTTCAAWFFGEGWSVGYSGKILAN